MSAQNFARLVFGFYCCLDAVWTTISLPCLCAVSGRVSIPCLLEMMSVTVPFTNPREFPEKLGILLRFVHCSVEPPITTFHMSPLKRCVWFSDTPIYHFATLTNVDSLNHIMCSCFAPIIHSSSKIHNSFDLTPKFMKIFA